MERLIAIMLVSVAPLYAENSDYSIKPITHTGVLFERVGKANFYSKHWTILTKMEMPELTNELEFVHNCSSLSTELCTKVRHIGVGTKCEVATKEIRSWVSRIERQNAELSHHMHGEASHRMKRSFFDGVGSLSKTLFGTMDQADSDDINSRLEDLDGRENRTFHLLKEQTTLIKSTFDVFNASRAQADAEREKLWSKISFIVAAQQNQSDELSTLQQRMEINEIITLMTIQLQEISDMQETLTNIMVSLNAGKLHPAIIHAREMTEIMANITRELDLDEKFQDFQLLIQIAKVQAIQADQKMLVRVEIPQPQRVLFELYKVYTIPTAMDQTGYHIYDLDAEFVAANNHERQYILLNYQQYHECQQLLTTADHPQILCPQLGPIITAIGDNCVLNLFRSFNVNAGACKEKTVAKWDSLVKMITRNHWLFVMSGKAKLEVNCQNSPTAIGKLVSTGALTIGEHCHLQMGDLLITSEDESRSNQVLWQPVRSELPAWDNIVPGPKTTETREPEKHKIRLLAAHNYNQAWKAQEDNIKKAQSRLHIQY